MNFLSKWFNKTAPARPVVVDSNPTLDFPVYDVTHDGVAVDLAAFDVLQWAPVWMTRAERLLMFTLTYTLRPRRYLEVGTLHGGSALIVAAAMDCHQTDGRIVCIDPRPQIAPEHWEKLAARATLIKGFSPAALPEAERAAGGQFDLILIDGDHSYAGALRDAQGVLPHAAPGAYILFHDSHYVEVMRAIDDFVAQAAGRVVDCGALTREATYTREPDAPPIRWGGLRAVRILAAGTA